jgi:hypothetical protein
LLPDQICGSPELDLQNCFTASIVEFASILLLLCVKNLLHT